MPWIISIVLGIVYGLVIVYVIGKISRRSDKRIRKMPDFLGPK